MLVGRVVIGMDPHKRSATIEVLDETEQPLMCPGSGGVGLLGSRRRSGGALAPQRVSAGTPVQRNGWAAICTPCPAQASAEQLDDAYYASSRSSRALSTKALRRPKYLTWTQPSLAGSSSKTALVNLLRRPACPSPGLL